MTISTERLRDEVGASTSSDDVIDECLTVAHELLLQYVGDEGIDVPPSVFDRAWLVAAVDLFNQSQAPNGVLTQQFDTGDGATSAIPVRVSRDPLAGAYPLLRSYVSPVSFA